MFRFSHSFYYFFVLVQTLFRHSHGFHLLPVLAWIQQCSGTHTDPTIFSYWFGLFFGTCTNSTFCRYTPSLTNAPVLTLILLFFRTGPDSFSALAWIPPFTGTRPDSTMFQYSLMLLFFRTGPDSFSVLARIQQCCGTHTHSTIFPYWS